LQKIYKIVEGKSTKCFVLRKSSECEIKIDKQMKEKGLADSRGNKVRKECERQGQQFYGPKDKRITTKKQQWQRGNNTQNLYIFEGQRAPKGVLKC